MIKLVSKYVMAVFILCFLACEQEPGPGMKIDAGDETPRKPDAVSLFGNPLFSPAPGEKLLAKLIERKRDYESDPENPDKLIWYGRFVAYSGDYEGAIEIFNKGAKQFPDDCADVETCRASLHLDSQIRRSHRSP